MSNPNAMPASAADCLAHCAVYLSQADYVLAVRLIKLFVDDQVVRELDKLRLSSAQSTAQPITAAEVAASEEKET